MTKQPQAQAQYDAVMKQALGIIYGEQSKNMVLQKLQGGAEDLPLAIGHTAANVLQSVVGGIEKQGRSVPKPVIAGVAQEIVAELMEIAIAAKLMEEGQAKEIAPQAMAAAKAEYAKLQGGQQSSPQGQQPAQAGGPMPPQAPPQTQGIIASRMGAGA